MRVSVRSGQNRPEVCFEVSGSAYPVEPCLQAALKGLGAETLRQSGLQALQLNPENFLSEEGVWGKLGRLHHMIWDEQGIAPETLKTLAIPTEAAYWPPIPKAPFFFGLAGNCPMTWRQTSTPIPVHPVGYTRTFHTLTPHGGRVSLPSDVTSFRCAVELGVVIGKRARKVSRDKAWDYVAGFTVVNDMISNHWKDFAAEKNPDHKPTFLELMVTSYYGRGTMGFAPVGPVIVSRDEIGNPYDLLMHSRLNGKTLDRSHTNAMVVGIEASIEYLSGFMTLLPGSVLHMGTMGLDGITLTAEKKLQPDDCVELEIEKIGTLRTYFADARGCAR